MAQPLATALTCTATTIDVVFDQPLVAPTNRPGEGFTITVNGAIRYANTAALVTTSTANDTVRLTVLGVLGAGDTVKLSYSNTANNLQNLTAELVANFTNSSVTNASLHASILSAIVAQYGTDYDTVTLTTSLPLTSVGGFATGVSVRQNGTTVPIVSVTQGLDPRQLAIKSSVNFQNQDQITWSYDSVAGDWQSSGYDIVTYTTQPVVNASKLGTPSAEYPLSTVIREQLQPVQSVVKATVALDLNSVDVGLLAKYGPVSVDTGGTFGVTNSNPDGVTLAQDLRVVKPGLVITKDFFVQGHPDWAATAASEWLNVMTQRITTVLSKIRNYDQTTALGTRTVRLV